MGLFDQVLNAAAGLAGQQAAGDNSALLGAVMQLIERNGGIGGLLQAFQNGGLGNVVQSWISTGQNLPISAEQIQGLLGNEQISALAGQLGVDPGQAATQLAGFLPQVVDKLTPDGQVPAGGDLMAQGMELLKGKFFG